ncbi:MAG: class I SAM-dependent methyltransferase [Patescibacteria group bacterium]
MKATGEQVIIGESSERTEAEHQARYAFATAFVKGKRVLDIACGTGYGAPTCIVAGATSYTGVDVSHESILYAQTHFAQAGVEFIEASAGDTLFPDASFDIICSFETIEHLEEEVRRAYLANLSRWLAPDGLVIISTPNKKVTSPFSIHPLNQFHVLEYRYDELIAELSPYLIVEKMFGQRLVSRWLTNYFVRRAVRLCEIVMRRRFGIYDTPTGSEVVPYDSRVFEPRFFVLLSRPKKQS